MPKSASKSVESRRSAGFKEQPNFVQADRLKQENIRKEEAAISFYTTFTINPYKPGYLVTGKVNSMQEAILNEGEEDPRLGERIQESRLPPTVKYSAPQTSSQEYGWISQPLVQADPLDVRFNHAKQSTDVTRHKVVEWTMLGGGVKSTGLSYLKPPTPHRNK